MGPSGAGDLAGMMRLDLIFGGEAESRFRLKVIMLVLCVSGLLLDWQGSAVCTLQLWSVHFLKVEFCDTSNLQVSYNLLTSHVSDWQIIR